MLKYPLNQVSSTRTMEGPNYMIGSKGRPKKSRDTWQILTLHFKMNPTHSEESDLAERRVKDEIRRLFDSQSLCVLATHSEAGPYTSLVAFAADEDLKNIYFVTSRFTRKYANIEADHKVAMLMDNRSDDPGDFRTATAVTAVGEASEISDQEKEKVLKRY